MRAAQAQQTLLFDTAIGRCALAWTAHGLRDVLLDTAGVSDIERRVHAAARTEPLHLAGDQLARQPTTIPASVGPWPP